MSFRKPYKSEPVEPGPVYREKLRRRRRLRALRTIILGSCVTVATFSVGMVATNWSAISSAFARNEGRTIDFQLCGTVRRTCIVDGDTFWLDGRKIRIADIDTPEISEPKCQSEYDLGMQATYRLLELLSAGPFELVPIPGRDKDQYGRDLRVVVRNGRSVGDQLVAEGLARTWSGQREPWCVR